MQAKHKRLTEERLPPYVSYRTWQRLLTGLTKHTPSRFDSSYFDAINVTKSNRSMIRGTLLFLGLIDSDGGPTTRLRHLVESEGESRPGVLADMVRHAYEPLFTDLDVTHATPAQIREYFHSEGASGDIGRKCLSFFFAIAAEAKIPISPHLRTSAPRPKARKGGADDTARGKAVKQGETEDNITHARLLLEKFPVFNPEWAPDIQKKWFDAYSVVCRIIRPTSYPRRSSAVSR